MSAHAPPIVDEGCGCAWAKSDPAGLARFVDPRAIRWIRPRLGPLDVSPDPAGRLALVRSLYDQLAGVGIRYALEDWNPDDRCQTIRSPAELIDKPALGTCLDLSTMFAGMCLGLDLLPVVAVTEQHALVLVSLRHSAHEWRAFGRPELGHFSPHPLSDVAALRELIDDGRYVAIETTGFAATDALPATSPEGAGRVDRLLTFERAVAAGRRRFELADDPLRFAIDIAATHGSGIGPQRICRDHRHVVVDDLVLAFGPSGALADRRARDSSSDLRALPPSQPPPPRPTRGVFGREPEQAVLRSARPGELTGVWGAAGIGKTELLRWLAFDPAPSEIVDGTIYVRREGAGPLDLLQEVFERCFDPADRVQLTMSSAARWLGAKRARLMIDDLDLAPSDVASVLDVLAEWVVVGTATDPTALVEGTSWAIAPLSPIDATRLFARESGIDVDGAMAGRLGAIFTTLGTNPRSVSTAGRAVASGDLPLDVFLASGDAGTIATPDASGPVAAILQAAYPAFVHRRLLTGLADDVDAELDELRSRECVETGSPRYRWIAGSPGTRLRDPSWEKRLVARLGEWLADEPPPDEIIEDRELLLRSIDISAMAGRWVEVVQVGCAIEPWFAIGNRWDAWGRVLPILESAARNVGDPVLEAYCRHQSGTRLLALGSAEAAMSELERAREMRERLNDRDGAEVTRHNIEVARGPQLTWWRRVRRLIRRHPWLSGVLVVLVVVGLIAAFVDPDPDPDPVADDGSTVTTLPPLVAVTVDPLDLGAVAIGGSRVGELVVVNEGDGPVDVRASGIEGSDEVTLVETGTICGEVPPGGSCAVGVNFVPVREQIMEASVAFEVGGDAVSGTVTGTGVLGLVLESDRGFETVPATNAAIQRFRLRSTADIAIDGVGVRIDPSDGPFAMSNGCPERFEAGQVCEFDVISEVPVGTDTTGALLVSVGEATIEATLTLSGVDPAAFELRVPAEFGEVLVGETVELPAVFANSGGSVGSLSLAPADPSDGFAVEASGCSDVEPGAECEVRVMFAPTEARVHELAVFLQGSDVVIATGLAQLGPVVMVDGDLDFGTVFAGEEIPVVRGLSIVNEGDRPAVVESIDVGGAGFGLSDAEFACRGELDGGERCDLTVLFRPEATGVFEGELTVDLEDADSLSRPIQGEFRLGGFATFAAVSDRELREQLGGFDVPDDWLFADETYEFDPDDLDYTQGTAGPTYDVGVVSSGVNATLIVLRNGGDSPLEIESVTNSGPDTANFEIVERCSGRILQPGPDQRGDVCRIRIAFTSAGVGNYETDISLTYDPDGLSPAIVTLQGSEPIG